MRTDEKITRTDRILAVGGGGAGAACLSARARVAVARGFSLIEVLMAVLILALGLLGLGAVLPVVVRQQAQGTEQSVSTSALQSGIEYIRGNSRLAPARWANFVKGDSGSRDFSPVLSNDQYWREGLWVVPRVDDFSSQSTTAARQYGSVSLFPRFVDFHPTSGLRETVLMEDRLYPSVNSGEAAPLFVWDLAVRRDFAGGGMQIAVFVRKIDTRAGNGLGQETLFGALLNPNSPASRRAVSVDNTGRPTLDGRFGGGRYSVPLVAEIFEARDPNTGAQVRNRLAIGAVRDTGSSPPSNLEIEVARSVIGQPGQVLIDNLGNRYTVASLYDGPSQYGNFDVVLTELIPLSVTIPRQGTDYWPPDIDPNSPTSIPPRVVRQVVFTPQVPAAVSVFNMGFELAPDVNAPRAGGNN